MLFWAVCFIFQVLMKFTEEIIQKPNIFIYLDDAVVLE